MSLLSTSNLSLFTNEEQIGHSKQVAGLSVHDSCVLHARQRALGLTVSRSSLLFRETDRDPDPQVKRIAKTKIFKAVRVFNIAKIDLFWQQMPPGIVFVVKQRCEAGAKPRQTGAIAISYGFFHSSHFDLQNLHFDLHNRTKYDTADGHANKEV